MIIAREARTLPRIVTPEFFQYKKANDIERENKNRIYFDTRRSRVVKQNGFNYHCVSLLLLMILMIMFFAFFIIPIAFNAFLEIRVPLDISITMTVFCVFFGYHMTYHYIRLIFMDPGIVVPNNDFEIIDAINRYNMKALGSLPKNPEMDISICGSIGKIKFCRSCHIHRPLRSSHCDICGYCINTFDHHCLYLGICIGARNYGSFIKLIIFGLLFAIFSTIFTTLLIHVLFIQSSDISNRKKRIVFVFLIISCIVFVIATLIFGVFIVFHFKFIATGLTTKENNKGMSYRTAIDGTNNYFIRIMRVLLRHELPTMFKYVSYHQILNLTCLFANKANSHLFLPNRPNHSVPMETNNNYNHYIDANDNNNNNNNKNNRPITFSNDSLEPIDNRISRKKSNKSKKIRKTNDNNTNNNSNNNSENQRSDVRKASRNGKREISRRKQKVGEKKVKFNDENYNYNNLNNNIDNNNNNTNNTNDSVNRSQMNYKGIVDLNIQQDPTQHVVVSINDLQRSSSEVKLNIF